MPAEALSQCLLNSAFQYPPHKTLGHKLRKERKGEKRFLGDDQGNFGDEYKHAPWSAHLYKQNCFAGCSKGAACHFDPTNIEKRCQMNLGTNSAMGVSLQAMLTWPWIKHSLREQRNRLLVLPK